MTVVMLNVASNGPAISKRRTSSPASCDSCKAVLPSTAGIYGCCFKKIGGFYPPKWMVYFNGKPYEQMDDLGYHYSWKHPYFGLHMIA